MEYSPVKHRLKLSSFVALQESYLKFSVLCEINSVYSVVKLFNRRVTQRPHFEQLINLLANSREVEMLKTIPIASASVLKEQQRLQKVYHFIEATIKNEIDVNAVAKMCNLTTAAFCRYFKKATHYTFTDFLNQFRINQSKIIVAEQECYRNML